MTNACYATTTHGFHRSNPDLREQCASRGWSFNTAKYDRGSDYVEIDFVSHGIAGSLYLNVFNGRFFGITKGGVTFTVCDAGSYIMHNRNWFGELLDCIYLPLVKQDN